MLGELELSRTTIPLSLDLLRPVGNYVVVLWPGNVTNASETSRFTIALFHSSYYNVHEPAVWGRSVAGIVINQSGEGALRVLLSMLSRYDDVL